MAKKKPNIIGGEDSFKGQKINSLTIIGIGASAGGLEALEKFFANMPSDSDLAFVVIQHLDPNHKSIMGSLLAKYSEMKILEAKDGMLVEKNCIYLNPPNKNMHIIKGKLQLMEPKETHVANLAIDYFFRSLSDDRAEKAIGIILSGTGTDGSLGAKAIKGGGGMIMAQDVNQAKFDGIPKSVIDTGFVDFILSVEKMPQELIKYIKHPFIQTDKKIDNNEHFQNYLEKIYALIRTQTGHDFSNYKKNTIKRRIERRMDVNKIDKLPDYIRFLNQTPLEISTIFKDLLISVTNFFRDKDAFIKLKEVIISHLEDTDTRNYPFRCWVPGCASGEEAYSIAMILVEALEESGKSVNIQIFASDIDENAIEIARSGIYPESIAADVSADRLNRFFTKRDHGFGIKKYLREMVVFANHNLIKDPPFSKLHLISCRNLLIYLDQVLQKKILPAFHYTLNPNGILMLGPSESIGEYVDLFQVVDSKLKIFKKLGYVVQTKVDYPNLKASKHKQENNNKTEEINVMQKKGIRELAQNLILKDFSPPCIIINEDFEILYFNGDTSKYLSPPIGEPKFNIAEMARDDIRNKLLSAIRKTLKQNSIVHIEKLQLKYNNSFLTIDVEIRPMADVKDHKKLVMIIFNDRTPKQAIEPKDKIPGEKNVDYQRILSLEQDLQSTKEYLHTTIQELEASNEELKSTNEELQSTNEELQSTNEEIETSKEELQSTNEELLTVNSELQGKMEELSQVNNDMNNLFASTEIGTIFLNNELKIKRYTPAMTHIFNLIPSDIDRPISDITSNIAIDTIFEDSKKVLDTLVSKEIELHEKDNIWYSVRISPYRTTDNIIDGIVITFIDISEIKEAEKIRRLAVIVQDSNDAICVQTLDGTITAWNKGAETMYGYSETEALKMNINDIIPEDKKKESNDIISKLKQGKPIKSFVTERIAKNGQLINIWLTVTRLADNSGNLNAIATTERDLKEIKDLK
ncbi:chemotaxis protein CheB [Bacteroidota bacterium]